MDDDITGDYCIPYLSETPVFMTVENLEHAVIKCDACVFDEDGFMKPEYEVEIRKSFRGDL